MVPPTVSPRTAASRAFAGRIVSAIDAHPAGIPVVLGGCGTGRTSMLRSLQEHYGDRSCQYIDVERAATTPERFARAIASGSPFVAAGQDREARSPRDAFDQTLSFLATARRGDGGPAMFLLDEALELRTFESFPGLRRAVDELLTSLAATRNRFVLASRYRARALRIINSARFPLVPVQAPGLSAEEIAGLLRAADDPAGPDGDTPIDDAVLHEMADIVRRLSDGRTAYADAMVVTMAAMRASGGGDPVSALTALLSPGGQLARRCEHSYEIRLHRARGYGALKAILDVLSDREPLTLTEVSQQLRRTPGSTKDYLSWLEDVDLVSVDQKRYRLCDPVLRLWVRLYCHPVPPTDDTVAFEVRQYAAGRLASQPPAGAA